MKTCAGTSACQMPFVSICTTGMMCKQAVELEMLELSQKISVGQDPLSFLLLFFLLTFFNFLFMVILLRYDVPLTII